MIIFGCRGGDQRGQTNDGTSWGPAYSSNIAVDSNGWRIGMKNANALFWEGWRRRRHQRRDIPYQKRRKPTSSLSKVGKFVEEVVV
jgi:hypothetical protein